MQVHNQVLLTTTPDIRYAYRYQFWRFQDKDFRAYAISVTRRLLREATNLKEKECILDLLEDLQDIRDTDFVVHTALRDQYEKVRAQQKKRDREKSLARTARPAKGVEIAITDWTPKLLDKVIFEAIRVTVLHAGSQKEAARLLGMGVRTLRNRLQAGEKSK